jgi:hypothetical protein
MFRPPPAPAHGENDRGPPSIHNSPLWVASYEFLNLVFRVVASQTAVLPKSCSDCFPGANNSIRSFEASGPNRLATLSAHDVP